MSVNRPNLTFQTGTYAVSRKVGGSFVNGRYTPIVVGLSVDAAIQPANGKQLMTLPEGRRTENVLVAYTNTELFIEDVVTVSGETLEVFKVARWDFRGVTHWESFLVTRKSQAVGS